MFNFREFINESFSVTQKIKTHPKNIINEKKEIAIKDINDNFDFHIDSKKKQDLINWYTLQLIVGMHRNKVQEFKDYLAYHINSINLKDSELTYQKLIEDSERWHDELSRNRQIGSKGRLGEKVISFKDGWFWVKLNRRECQIEAGSMGHCGNSGGKENDIIFSLRDPNNVPYLTFIVNNGVLGESKGRFNSKPEKKFHPYIYKLLESKYIDYVAGGGYQPENNFEENDLSSQMKQSLLKIKPRLFDTKNHYINKIHNNQSFELSHNESLKILTSKKSEENNDYYDYEYKNKRNKSVKIYGTQPNYYGANEKLIQLAKKSIKRTCFEQLVELINNKTLSEEHFNEIKTLIDYYGDNYLADGFVELMKYCKLHYKSYYSKIYNLLSKRQKSLFIKYLIAIDVPVTRNEYYDLLDKDVEIIVQQMNKRNIKVPDELMAVFDYRKKDIIKHNIEDNITPNIEDIQQVKEFIVSIIDKIIENKKIDSKEEIVFNKISLLKLHIVKYLVSKIKNIYSGNEISDNNLHYDICDIIYPRSVYWFYDLNHNQMILLMLSTVFNRNFNLSNDFKDWARKILIAMNKGKLMKNDTSKKMIEDLNDKLLIGGSDLFKI